MDVLYSTIIYPILGTYRDSRLLWFEWSEKAIPSAGPTRLDILQQKLTQILTLVTRLRGPEQYYPDYGV